MPTNFYFQSGITAGTTNEQRLLEDLIIESMKIYGHDVYYVPRHTVKLDTLLGEDVLSRFTEAYPIEMYIQNIEGWDGDGELFTKFGIQVTHQATFVVSKRRWEDVVSGGYADSLQLPERPAEGDIIYFPKTNNMFEIKFVQHLDPFFQLGKFYIYSMQCELYQYSSEVFDTGVGEIDEVNRQSQDQFQYNLLLQAGGNLLLQNNGAVLLAAFDTKTIVPFSDNTLFDSQSLDILDFTSVNPFGEF